MRHATPLLLLAALLVLSQCKKKDPGPAPTPESLLPPATQTGANTFGCLLNGQPWTPAGFDGTTNYSVSYDPGYAGGTLSINAYRYFGPEPKNVQDIVLGATNLSSVGTYQLMLRGERGEFTVHGLEADQIELCFEPEVADA